MRLLHLYKFVFLEIARGGNRKAAAANGNHAGLHRNTPKLLGETRVPSRTVISTEMWRESASAAPGPVYRIGSFSALARASTAAGARFSAPRRSGRAGGRRSPSPGFFPPAQPSPHVPPEQRCELVPPSRHARAARARGPCHSPAPV